ALVDNAHRDADARGLHDFEGVLRADAVASEPRPIGRHRELWRAEHAFDANVPRALNGADDRGDLVAFFAQLFELVAKDGDLDVGARAADELVGLVLDRLRDGNEGARHVLLDLVFDRDRKLVEILRRRPLFL